MRPAYDYGDAVRVIRHLRNDGTFPGRDRGTLLIRRGSTGYVRDVGTFLQDQLIYSVHFVDQDLVVGCREQELQPAEAVWVESRFDTRDKVVASLTLASAGRVLVEAGTPGEVVKVLRGERELIGYHVQFPEANLLQVPESALEPADQSFTATESVA
ncbi:nitrogen fixation protein NifZ [Rhabdochromatium marinum]|uniref:nitrogen fixation protein NifZ n=1 Tax=Rhabdochromatium marinum TaxID=48729 RepID=UPI001903C1BA|nr:nitrogen fixation protein NifZ [Rhabdochromatium marinum]MBK1647203.1 nitrogen fixation protein NifZ [Rhabdochromatium marinum]